MQSNDLKVESYSGGRTVFTLRNSQYVLKLYIVGQYIIVHIIAWCFRPWKWTVCGFLQPHLCIFMRAMMVAEYDVFIILNLCVVRWCLPNIIPCLCCLTLSTSFFSCALNQNLLQAVKTNQLVVLGGLEPQNPDWSWRCVILFLPSSPGPSPLHLVCYLWLSFWSCTFSQSVFQFLLQSLINRASWPLKILDLQTLIFSFWSLRIWSLLFRPPTYCSMLFHSFLYCGSLFVQIINLRLFCRTPICCVLLGLGVYWEMSASC